MVFSSVEFIFLFLPLLLLLYYLPVNGEAGRKWKNNILLLFSIVFYTWGEPKFVFSLIAMILINWIMSSVMVNSLKHKKTLIRIIVAVDVLFLGIFKYLAFVIENVSHVLGYECPSINIMLPIGISFYTFQIISYVFDVYYGRVEAQRNPLNFMLYTMLFPQLVAGPIVRYRDIDKSIDNRFESMQEFVCGVRRFIYGLAKKVLVANYLGQITDNIFDYIKNPSLGIVWLGAIAYTLQIYYDFSGYSDMAIGLGHMFGFNFPDNFNYPYISKTITEFWRRWHISLSLWFRDYVYIPLGGNRVEKGRWIVNMFLVWMLTGLWHGANWTFVIWGLLYFLTIVLEKGIGIDGRGNWLTRIYTLGVVIVGWVMFRAPSVKFGLQYIGYMLGIGTAGVIDNTFIIYLSGSYVIFAIALIGTTPVLQCILNWCEKKNITWLENIWILVLLSGIMLKIVGETYNPFIYFNF